MEIAIGTSYGRLSKIENGKINPTKETIFLISKILKLNSRETNYILGINDELPSNEEIQNAVLEIAGYFNKKGVFAYLLDDRWRFHKFSKSWLNILKMKQEDIDTMIGKTTVQVILDNKFNLIENLSKKHYSNLLETHIPYYYSQTNFFINDNSFKETKNLVFKNTTAKRIWIDSLNSKGIYSGSDQRIVYFNVFGVDIPMKFSREPLFKNPRFEVVEYQPIHKFVDYVSRFIG